MPDVAAQHSAMLTACPHPCPSLLYPLLRQAATGQGAGSKLTKARVVATWPAAFLWHAEVCSAGVGSDNASPQASGEVLGRAPAKLPSACFLLLSLKPSPAHLHPLWLQQTTPELIRPLPIHFPSCTWQKDGEVRGAPQPGPFPGCD